MSDKPIEISVLGHMLRFNCPEEQQDILRQAVYDLSQRISEMKERRGIVQLEKALTIVALNFSYELLQEKQKNHQFETVLKTGIQELNRSLESLQKQKSNPDLE